MRERPCSAGDAAWCDGSERDVEVCNDNPCYDWTVKDRIFLSYFQIYNFKNQNAMKKNLKRVGQDGLPGPNVQNLAEKAKKSETDFAKILTMHAKDLITRLKAVTKWSARQTFVLRS